MFQKNRFLFVLLFAVQSLFAQIPQGFNYQATVRNQTGELLTNEYVGIRFHIVQGTEQNNPVYSELHYESTDDLGSLHLMIGQGAVEAGAFNQIDWSLGDYHTGIEINTGDGFIDMGTTQLMSVPFALYALNSGTTNNASLPQGTNDGDVLRWNSATNSWTVEDVSVNLSPVYLAENGITVKARDWAGIGAKGMLNGVEYTVVDIEILSDMFDFDYGPIQDVTSVCTTRITNMGSDLSVYNFSFVDFNVLYFFNTLPSLSIIPNLNASCCSKGVTSNLITLYVITKSTALFAIIVPLKVFQCLYPLLHYLTHVDKDNQDILILFLSKTNIVCPLYITLKYMRLQLQKHFVK